MTPSAVMPGLVPGIPVLRALRFSHRDHRHKAGDDEGGAESVIPGEPKAREGDP